MLFILVATILILGMTALFVKQGLFSSMIMAVLSLLCAAFALNAYPALASMALYDRQGPIANAVSLTALFLLSLLAAKELADFLLPKTVQFPLWADRVGGGAFGLVASMTMVGVVLVVAQMLPMGNSVFGYEPYDDALQRQGTVWPFFADDFAVAVGKLGSVGAFGGEGSFNDLHDDLLREAAAARNTAGSNGTTWAAPDSMKLKGAYRPTWEQLQAALKIGEAGLPEDPLLAGPAGEYLVVGTKIDDECGDADKWTRLAGTQFRLVAGIPEGEGAKAPLGPPIDHYPIAYFYAPDANTWKKGVAKSGSGVAQIGKLLATVKSNKIPLIYWVYQLGKGERPDYVVFRQVSAVKVHKPKPDQMPKNPLAKPVKKPTTAPAKPPTK